MLNAAKPGYSTGQVSALTEKGKMLLGVKHGIDKERTMVLNYVCTLPIKMFGPFWSVWCKMALAEVGVSLP